MTLPRTTKRLRTLFSQTPYLIAAREIECHLNRHLKVVVLFLSPFFNQGSLSFGSRLYYLTTLNSFSNIDATNGVGNI